MEQYKMAAVPTGRLDGRSYLLFCPKENGAVVIDPDVNMDEILRLLEEENASLKYILLTHCHFDHMSSSDALRERTGAKAAIHRLDLPGLSDPAVNVSELSGGPLITGRQIDTVLEEGSVVSVCGLEIQVLHTPGHTPGSCCFLTGNNLFSGDTLFRGSYGNTGFPGGDMKALIHSTARLFKLDGALNVYPGHGQSTTIARERASNPINL